MGQKKGHGAREKGHGATRAWHSAILKGPRGNTRV